MSTFREREKNNNNPPMYRKLVIIPYDALVCCPCPLADWLGGNTSVESELT